MDNTENEQAIRVLMDRGDLSLLSTEQRQDLYLTVCRKLGLDPHFAPLVYLRLQGKLVLYLTRTATDQLAKIHGLSREIIDGPRVLEIDGTKMLYAVCRARLPSGREECAVATLPMQDPINGLMKLDTKAKRRVTLAILGLSVLDDEKDDASPAEDAQPATKQIPSPSETKKMPAKSLSLPIELTEYVKDVSEIDVPEKAVPIWLRYRERISKMSDEHKQAAWQQISARLVAIGVASGGRWLTAAVTKREAESAEDEEPLKFSQSTLSEGIRNEMDALSTSLVNSQADTVFVGKAIAAFWAEKKNGEKLHDGELFGALERLAKRYAARKPFISAVEDLEHPSREDPKQSSTSASSQEAALGNEEPPRSDPPPPPDDRESSQPTEAPQRLEATAVSAPGEGKPITPDPRIQALRVDLNKAVVDLRDKTAACAVWLHHATILPSNLKGNGYQIVEKAMRMLDPSIQHLAIVDLIREESLAPVEKAKERDFCGPVDLELWKRYLEGSDRDGSVAGSISKRMEKLVVAHGKTMAEAFYETAVSRIMALRRCSRSEAVTLIRDISKSNENRRSA